MTADSLRATNALSQQAAEPASSLVPSGFDHGRTEKFEAFLDTLWLPTPARQLLEHFADELERERGE